MAIPDVHFGITIHGFWIPAIHAGMTCSHRLVYNDERQSVGTISFFLIFNAYSLTEWQFSYIFLEFPQRILFRMPFAVCSLAYITSVPGIFQEQPPV